MLVPGTERARFHPPAAGDEGQSGRALRPVGEPAASSPWNGSWNGWPRNPSAMGASDAIRRAICAGQAMSARAQASRNAPLAGSTGRTAHRGVANHRWVMSQAAGVHERPSSPRSPAPALHGEPPRLAPSRAAPLSTASLLHTLLHPKPRKALASRPERRCTPHDLPVPPDTSERAGRNSSGHGDSQCVQPRQIAYYTGDPCSSSVLALHAGMVLR